LGAAFEPGLAFDEAIPVALSAIEDLDSDADGVSNLDELFMIIDQKVLAEMKAVLQYQNAGEQAKDWWKAFEEANKANTVTVIELCQELFKRGVTIESFFGAYIHSEATSIPGILQVLDELLARPVGRLPAQRRTERSASAIAAVT